MFIPTMSDAEIQQEARRDFFELSTPVQIALDRFRRANSDLISSSYMHYNDTPINLIKKSAQSRKWKTRRHNTWTSYFRFLKESAIVDSDIQWYLYTLIHRANGTEYIFQSNLKKPVAERFTMHFIERYKERHLKAHNIEIGAMPVPLYFLTHNTNCFMGKYYKNSDIDIDEGKHKKFWIAPEGIYVTDYIDGLFTYITFMDKDDLSPLKKQVYEEEVVWDLLLRAVSDTLSPKESTKATYKLMRSANLGPVFERFLNRNVKDEADGEKQKLISYVREQMIEVNEIIDDTKKYNKENLEICIQHSFANRVFNTLDANSNG